MFTVKGPVIILYYKLDEKISKFWWKDVDGVLSIQYKHISIGA